MRQKHLFLSITNICILGFCLPKCIRIKIPVLVQNFGMTDHDLLPFSPMYFQFYKTGQILSEVDQFFSFWRHDQLLCQNPFCNTDRFIFLGCQSAFVKFHHRNRSCSDTTLFTILCFADRRIDRFSHINLAVTNRSRPNIPTFIRTNHFPASVFIFQMDLRKCTDSVTINVRHQHKPENSFIPAVSDHDLDFIFFPEHFRNIINLILQTMMITCPSRRHSILSDAFSVQIRFIDTSACGVNSCFFYISFC